MFPNTAEKPWIYLCGFVAAFVFVYDVIAIMLDEKYSCRGVKYETLSATLKRKQKESWKFRVFPLGIIAVLIMHLFSDDKMAILDPFGYVAKLLRGIFN